MDLSSVYFYATLHRGIWQRIWLRHYTSSWKVTGSIP